MMWLILVLSGLLTLGLVARGVEARSWPLLWLAALTPWPWALLGISAALAVLLAALPCVSVSLGFRWQVSRPGWLLLGALGLLIWLLAGPGQVALMPGGMMPSPLATVLLVVPWLLTPCVSPSWLRAQLAG